METVTLTNSDDAYEIYIEAGQKKVFAVAVDWPGWCRFGKDETAAVQKFIEAAPRYAQITSYANLEFSVPQTSAAVKIAVRLQGNITTDFGAPDMQLAQDWEPVEADQLERYVKLLNACWLAFEKAVENAAGKELQKGPRGGGRELSKIIEHVVAAEEAYLKRLGFPPQSTKTAPIDARKDRVRDEIMQGLQTAAAGQLPREGPRGGKRWSPRFFVRRAAWHTVDHTWEIEDRLI